MSLHFLQTKEFLKDPSKFAAVAAAVTAAPAESAAPAAAAETKKEESEESDDDMGFGLFDWVALGMDHQLKMNFSQNRRSGFWINKSIVSVFV